MKKVLFGLLSLVIIAGTACKKSKDAPAFTKENVAGVYKLEKVTFKYGSTEQDITDQWVDDCEKDNVLTLSVNGTYQSDDQGEACTGDYDGVWSIPAANKFTMDGDDYDLAKWDGSTLAISMAYDFGGNDGQLITYMKKQ